MPDPFQEDAPARGVLPAAANPFKPGPGKVPPAFGGREQPLWTAKTIVDRLAVPADPVDMPLLRGVRGVGKTALMAYARHHASASGTVSLHIEADAGDQDLTATCQTLLRDARELTVDVPTRLARRLSALDVTGRVEFHPPSGEDPNVTLEALLYDLVLLGAQHGRGLLLTVDEVHEAEELLLRPLVRAVHRHAQDGRPLGVMLSGLPGSARTLLEEGQTYAERVTTFDLGLLAPSAVAEALRRPFRSDAGVDVDDAVIEHVHTDTGGYPHFVQLWGEALWNTLEERREVRHSDAVRAEPAVQQREETFFGSRWERITGERARELVRALAQAGGHSSMNALARACGFDTQRPLSAARDGLLREGHTYVPKRGQLAFTVPGFAGWLAQPPRE